MAYLVSLSLMSLSVTIQSYSFSNRNDIGPPASWDNLFRIINQVVPITQFAGPGAWNGRVDEIVYTVYI